MSLKSSLRNAVTRSARNPSIYRHLWHPLSRLVSLANREHEWQGLELGKEFEDAAEVVRRDLTVRSGPFAGMVYAAAESAGSAFTPKLLGCYEQELHAIVESAIQSSPEIIVDIGAAEGYYAVGLAMRLPSARVIAYDTDPKARELCRAMAQANRVAQRVEIRGTCDQRELLQLSGTRSLIWCDCEGFERVLFTKEIAHALRTCQFVIETHDFVHPETTSMLREAFAETHDLTLVRSVPDGLRPTVYPQALLASYREDIRIALMAESRPANMTWLWCQTRHTAT